MVKFWISLDISIASLIGTIISIRDMHVIVHIIVDRGPPYVALEFSSACSGLASEPDSDELPYRCPTLGV